MLADIGISVFSNLLTDAMKIIFSKHIINGTYWKIYFDRYKYRDKEIRLSFSYLYRIEVNGKYLLVRGRRLKNQYQPIGGVYKFYESAKVFLHSINYVPDTKMQNFDETDDLRIRIRGRFLLKFFKWFQEGIGRETEHTRELEEELFVSNLINKESFGKIKIQRIKTHNEGITYSNYLNIDEWMYSEIYEINLSHMQKELILNAVSEHPLDLCLASVEEIRTQCYKGIEHNIGNNAIWLIE